MSSRFPELIAYEDESRARVEKYSADSELQAASHSYLQRLIDHQYGYNFFWCGVPVIQIGQEIQALQEIIWSSKPDCIIETGVAWGGSLMLSASMLCVLEACSLIDNGLVVGIDIDIRAHNRKNIESHPLSSKIHLLEGSSIDESIYNTVLELTKDKKRILVCLDSNHTHDHVLRELQLYAPLVSINSYCMVGDTGIDDYENAPHTNRSWGHGNSPKSAVHAYLQENDNFVIDKYLEGKLLLTGSPDGYLKRIK